MSSEKTVQELKKELQELETTMKEKGRDAVSNVKRNKLKKKIAIKESFDMNQGGQIGNKLVQSFYD